MEHLASLSAAAGAAMKQRAQQAAAAAAANGTAPEDSVDATLAASTALRPQSSRPSLRSFPSRSEAEEAESDALEKAERDYLAKIGQSCDEWAKMVVCRLCASVSVADTKQRRRSGTLTPETSSGCSRSAGHECWFQHLNKIRHDCQGGQDRSQRIVARASNSCSEWRWRSRTRYDRLETRCL